MRFSSHRAWPIVTGMALLTASLAACGRPAAPTSAGPRDLGPVSLSSFKGGKPATVGVPFRSRNELSRLVDAGLEIWYVDQDARRAYGQIGQEHFSAVQRLGAQLRVVQAPGVFNDFDSGYHTYDELKAAMADLAAKHGDKVQMLDIGDGWEKTQGKSDRDVLALRIGKGDPAGKPGVLFCGNHHARELVTPEVVLKIAQMLVDGYGKDADLTNFVDNRDIWLVPMVNPDGHRLASEGRDWRKNTDLSHGGGTSFSGAPNGPGVDLNRNYGFKWGLPGASANVSAPTFRGSGPFSEPETQAIKKLVESRKWAFLMTYHSFSNLILWPWGHTDAPPPDNRLAPIGQKLGTLSGYKPQQSVKLYPTSGDTTDWAFGEHGILAYTTEIGSWGDGFDPPYSKLPKFWKENEPGARLLLQLADNPSHVFGPEVSGATVSAGRLTASAAAEAVEVEVFSGRAGADGTGVKAPVANGQVALSTASFRSANGLLLVHARDAKGNWGPLVSLFNR
ncbi:MAG: M14 family metallopeptidase [Candidatus Sericytochromatia bacterium]|nr:M14 family metallopeptidase [Candidatus Sericytochromatia bacterium]